MRRQQFPVRLAFGMTINKAQNQTLGFLGLYLASPVFSHGQLYVAMSRVRSSTAIKIVIDDRKLQSQNGAISDSARTPNIVYKEIDSQRAIAYVVGSAPQNVQNPFRWRGYAPANTVVHVLENSGVLVQCCKFLDVFIGLYEVSFCFGTMSSFTLGYYHVAFEHITNGYQPCKVHKQAAKRTLCFMRTTQHYALTYYYDPSSPISISGYVDANWSDDDPRCFSTGGYVFTLAGGPISWQTKRQSSIASSSTEAEYVAAALALHEALWIFELITELKLPFNVSTAPITLFCDNQSTIAVAESSSFSSKLKHIKISFHFLKELVANGFIKLVYAPSTKNWADFLTKSVSATKQTASSCGLSLIPTGG
ncbi:hypothetical protein L7F22_039517 [Adiantum nelumboides]|nr:hypothetical protein [Adiantum nelumboides]